MGLQNQPPPDFSLKYRWCEGTVPPPHYYEYSIAIGPKNTGEIKFYPDYPQHDLPVWVEHFDISSQAWMAIYAQMTTDNLFRQAWTEIQNAPVGGSLEWLDITAQGVEYKIPSMIEEAAEVEQVYEAIRTLVPIKVWKKLMSQREDFIHKYPAQ